MNKASDFLSLLDVYITTYLPCSIGSSPNTVKSYKYAFRLLIEFMYKEKGIEADKITFDKLDYKTLTDFFTWIESIRGCSASTKNQRLSAIASFSAYAQNRNFAAASVFRNSVNKIPMKKTQQKQRAILTRQEVTILLSLPNENREIGLRDKILLSLMYASGARAQEICDLTVGNLQFQPKGATLNIKGKGGKSRRIGIPAACATLLKQYIDHRKISDKPERHIFSSQTHEYMTIACIEGIFKKYITIAKKENPSIFLASSYPPHSMRHTTASHMLEAGVPLLVIKNFLGHASLQTTQIYAEISQDTVNRHLKEWNEKWFPNNVTKKDTSQPSNRIPDFLK
ncbi:site-specific integrase [Caldibacillus sp. 210928-DFI.2.22]|uniref:tyrosine-type recombinase/integrase n=1 Tax=unclassified Caldibacillus TaxID=2641266 RepID=UPI001D0880A6|nr:MULTISPECIES: tyrosine-type recombinase/integrase [unclassified Caldibacillus]MCB7069231.1 site-specific integrase [Caldibacillus sp. 210928-DFI.2.22]MCB7072655.1 site-specific integrase [Caldibacillus sp. 210928-DFI.2.18]